MTTPEQHLRYNQSPKGRLRKRRYREERLARGQGHDNSVSPPSWTAERQREYKARPECVLARHLGVGVIVARAIIESGGTT